MRSEDLIRATPNTKIYLDMDGVLADFFAEYAKLAGVTSGSYRDIPPAKADPTLDKMIGTDFFARLPMFPTAPSLIKMVLGYVKSYGICSSPLRGDFKNSEHYKRVWIKNHLRPQPAEIIITGQKERHAVNADGSPNILIDDRGTNIVAWRARGGIGIKYQADEDSLDKVAVALAMAYGDNMKSKDFMKESDIDAAIDQAQNPAPAQPGTLKKATQAFGQGMVPAGSKPGIAGGIAGTLRKASNIVTNTPGGSAPAQQGFWTGDKAGGQQEKTYVPGQVDPQVVQYLKAAAGNRPLKQATDNAQINALLKSAGLLK